MIFNTETYYDDMQVGESPYPVGLEGALMHVYENECNYNAMMKAVGISELRYYQDTGKSLFVHEAGVFASFIQKAKEFFKKVIEKIKQIFHKFAAVMNQYTMKDKEFVKKYSKELYRKNITDFTFDGYTFKNLDDAVAKGKLGEGFDDYKKDGSETYTSGRNRAKADAFDDVRGADSSTHGTDAYRGDKAYDSDALETAEDSQRGTILNSLGITGASSKAYDSSDFREELHDYLYGDGGKETLDKINVRQQLQYIENTKKDVREVERQQKEITRAIDKFIKMLDKWETEFNKKDAKWDADTAGSEKYSDKATDGSWESDQSKQHNYAGANINDTAKDRLTKYVNFQVSLKRSASNDITTAFGMIIQAVKDRNRQAKAICVKIIGYKNESASYGYYGESSVNDIFAGVTIR